MILHYAGKYDGDERNLPQREHPANAVPFKEMGMMFVVGTEDMSKGRFIFMCLCPNLFLGAIPFVIFLIFPYLTGAGLFGLIAVGMGFADYINVYNAVRQMPKGAKTYLCGMHSYWYERVES